MKNKFERDIRLAATSKIWSYATGMLAICIPLVGITRSPILPLAVITGAAAGTYVVWRSDNQPRSPLLTSSVKELEQRVANLETIISTQELDLEHKIKRLNSKE